MRRSRAVACGFLLWSAFALLALPVTAQDAELTLTTPYPAQSVEVGKTVNLPLKVRAVGLSAQIVDLSMASTADGWTASFIGDGRAVQAVYVEPDTPGSVSLKLEPSADVQPGTYEFTVAAQSRNSDRSAQLPITLRVEEQLPPQLSLDVELPTLQGTPNGTVTYQATLANEGDRNLTVNLSADAPENFDVTFKARFENQTVTSLPISAGSSRDLSIEVSVPEEVSAGEYRIGVQAAAEDVEETQILNAVIEGQPDLSVTTSGDPVSTQATIGETTSVDFVVRNRGNAAAEEITLTSSSPSGWNVEFQPASIGTIQPGNETQVTAQISPSDDTIAGDYFVTLRARSGGGISDATEFRVTAQRSTIWGAYSIAIIVVALGIIGLAVVRFGRR